jgi:hypothetical protein
MEHRTYKRDGSPQPGKFNNRKLYVVRNINRSELTEAANEMVPRWQKVLLDTLQLTSNDHMRTAISKHKAYMNCPHNSYPNFLSVYLTHTHTYTKRLRPGDQKTDQKIITDHRY